MIAELIRTPQQYFAERIKYPQLRTQTIIVLLVGVVANLWRVALFDILGAAVSYIEEALIILTIGGMFEFLGWWLVLTAVMHFVANVQGGDSRYGQLLRLTGYGFLPMILSGIIWSAGRYMALQGADAPPAPPQSSFVYQYESFQTFMEQIAGDPILLGSTLFGALFVLASGYLWVRAVSVAAQLDRDEALVPAGLAVAIYLVYVLLPLV